MDNNVNEQQNLDLAEALRKRIRASGMSINSLAKAVGVTHATLHWFVHGKRELTMATVQKLVDYFNLELRHAEEEVARQYDADFIPNSRQEVVALRHEYYYAHMTALEHDKKEFAKQARMVEPVLRQGGHIKQADAFRVLAARAEHHAAQLRAYIETRLEPERAKVVKILERTRAKDPGAATSS
jgi:AcrR family transcriptional regulator